MRIRKELLCAILPKAKIFKCDKITINMAGKNIEEIIIPEERKFLSALMVVNTSLIRCDNGDEQYNWNIIKTWLGDIYAKLPGFLQKKYKLQYVQNLHLIDGINKLSLFKNKNQHN